MDYLLGFGNLAAYHLLCYGTLLGAEVFHSFIGGIISFRALSRPQFSVLQQNIFPVYFCMQAVMPLILVLTYPSPSPSIPSSYAGVLHNDNQTSVLLPLFIMFAAGSMNWTVFGPATTKTMKLRKHQETRDGKKYYDAGPHSEEMKKLNRSFSTLHGISSLANLIQIISTIWYGVGLSARL